MELKITSKMGSKFASICASSFYPSHAFCFASSIALSHASYFYFSIAPCHAFFSYCITPRRASCLAYGNASKIDSFLAP